MTAEVTATASVHASRARVVRLMGFSSPGWPARSLRREREWKTGNRETRSCLDYHVFHFLFYISGFPFSFRLSCRHGNFSTLRRCVNVLVDAKDRAPPNRTVVVISVFPVLAKLSCRARARNRTPPAGSLRMLNVRMPFAIVPVRSRKLKRVPPKRETKWLGGIVAV